MHGNAHVGGVDWFRKFCGYLHRWMKPERIADVFSNTAASKQSRRLHRPTANEQILSLNPLRSVSTLQGVSIQNPLSPLRANSLNACCCEQFSASSQKSRHEGFGHGLPSPAIALRLILEPARPLQRFPTQPRCAFV